ncbi:hypothetical protein IQ255_14515 [Pleurocapsales cyanobacterium LEGE 10410]|nr:hypothetical protein [Pleurocapsales cyanobacterium LEGE 10410]
MKRLDITKKFAATSEAKGYLDYLVDKKQVFKRAIDAYVFAATYAIKQNADVSQSLPSRSNSLVEVYRLDDDVRLALEAGIYAICKHNHQPEPENSAEVMKLLTKYAEIGIQLLQQKWKDKTSTSQIQRDIWRMIND